LNLFSVKIYTIGNFTLSGDDKMKHESFKICPKCNTDKNVTYKVLDCARGICWYYKCTCGTEWLYREGASITLYSVSLSLPIPTIPEKPKLTEEQQAEIAK
jgi:hypothetical protein